MDGPTVVDAFATWLTLPLQSQLVSSLLLVAIFSFLLIALVLFIKAAGPVVSATPKGDVKVSFLSRLFKRKKKPVATTAATRRPSLLKHRYFRLMRNIQVSGFFQIGSSGCPMLPKEAINLAFLRDCKFKVFEDGISEFVKVVESLKSDEEKEEKVQQISSVISNLIDKYVEMSASLRIELPDDRVIYGVPSTYINKFNKWHSDHISMCLEAINDILGDKLYEDWFAELRACLDILYIAFQLTIQDAKQTLNELNGELDKEIAEILR